MERHRRQAGELFADGQVPPPQGSVLYLVGLLVVGLLLITMPLAYLGLIGLGGYGIYYHTTEHFGALYILGEARQLLFLIFAIGLYLLPIIGGFAVLLFLIKPIFAPAAPRPAALSLDPESEPILTAFIEEICARMNVPVPSSIELSTDLSASASYRGGIQGLVRHDLVLTIGLPLVVGLDVRQLAGVIAHELGHFNQTISMRLSYTVRQTQSWFNRIAFERDAWDCALEEWSEENDHGIFSFILVLIIQAGVGLGRLILAALARASQFGISLMLRQMEYNADHYGIVMSGSASYEALMLRLAVLARATKQMQSDMRNTLKGNGELPNNIAALLSHYADSVSDSVRSQWEGKEGLVATGWFDTHPSTADRIRRARQLNAPGMIRENKRAIDLFQDFDGPAQQVTLTYYQDLFRQEIPTGVLYDVTVKADALPTPKNVREQTSRFFYQCLEWHRPLHVPQPDGLSIPPTDESIHSLQECVVGLAAVQADINQVVRRLQQTQATKVRARKDWLLASVRVDNAELPDLEPLEAALQTAENDHTNALTKLAAAWNKLGERVRIAFLVLSLERVRETWPEAKKLARQYIAIQHALDELRPLFNQLAPLSATLQDLEWLLAIEADGKANRFSRTRQLGTMGECRHAILALEEQLSEIPYHFTPSGTSMSVENHIRDTLTPLIIGDATTVLQRGKAVVQAIVQYHDTLAAALANVVEGVEQHVGPFK